MHGRTALTALLVSAALYGCGQAKDVAPVMIEITDSPPPAATAAPASEAPRAPTGQVRQGTLQTRPAVIAPPPAPASALVAPGGLPGSRPQRPSLKRFRASQLRALRPYCATDPPGDPRCADGRVDERVAFAAFEGRR